MLEKPDLHDAEIIARLRDAYALNIGHVEFLPLGADVNTAVYRATAADATDYFVKLRRGTFDEMTLHVPKLLHDQGVTQVIAPMPTQSGQFWTPLGEFTLTVSPFIDGHDGYETGLTEPQWAALGRALKALHTAEIQDVWRARLQQERYSDEWRKSVRRFQAEIETTDYIDPVSAALAAFLRDKREIVNQLVQRAESLVAALQARSLPFVLSHADIHCWNVLISSDGRFYIVDWDTLILAPKERDLMFIGGGLFANHRTPAEEARLFYVGYGETMVDAAALAYYRCERIVQDIAAYCEQILLTEGDSPDRANGLRQLQGQFLPSGVIDAAFRGDQ